MSLRLLLNENFPAPSVAILRHAGFDLLSVAESHASIDDVDVLALAVREQRCIVTFDRDYGELLVASYRPEEPAEWVMRLAADEKECLGRFTVLDGNGIRSRPLLYEVANGRIP